MALLTAMAAGMKSLILVMAGGAVGAAMRFQLSRMLPGASDSWPWPTFAANVLGGFLMGVLAAYIVRGGAAGEPLRLLLGVGLLGGFTTFSAFSLEILQLIQRGAALTALAYALASVALAVFAVFGGLGIGRAVLT